MSSLGEHYHGNGGLSEDEGSTWSDVEDESLEPLRPSDAPRTARIIKSPRVPTPGLKIYTTEHYHFYDPQLNNVGRPVKGRFVSFKQYDGYTLYMNARLRDVDTIPTSGVRLDDLTISKVLSVFSRKKLSQAWPAEFDTKGMVRATRVPLGCAAKRWVDVGESDADENVVGAGQEGYYYQWWRGLHCLMGKEGYDAGQYMIRPSHETGKTQGLSFKISHKAVVQRPSEDSNDEDLGTSTTNNGEVEGSARNWCVVS